MKNLWIWNLTALGFAAFALSSCGKHEEPNFIYMPDMHYQPSIKAQKGIQRLPVEGTIPRGFVPYAYASLTAVEAGKLNRNPLPRTAEVLKRGQVLFNTYCIVCHGPYGEGDGYVVPKFPRPPSLQSDKVRGYEDGSIYHVITNGQNLMSSYASQVVQKDRWAIIHYIRALQKAKHPTPEDLATAEKFSSQ